MPAARGFVWAGEEVALSVPGAHNVANAAAALTACVVAGAEPAAARGHARRLRRARAGASRRWGRRVSGALVVDDYAHHPTEVRAAIHAARTLGRRRVVAVFQPHLFSRTQLLAREFGAALALGRRRGRARDLPVARARRGLPRRQRPAHRRGRGGRRRAGGPVGWAGDFDAAERLLAATLRDGDVCLVLGAGDVDALGRDGCVGLVPAVPDEAPARARAARRTPRRTRRGDLARERDELRSSCRRRGSSARACASRRSRCPSGSP